MEPRATKILMVGLPESGKTTYLAALFNSVRSPDSLSRPTALRLVEMPDDRAYFHEIERTWLDLRPMERSLHSQPRDASLVLADDQVQIALDIPDVSGEEFNLLWESGSWSEELKALALSASGVVLFVRSDAVRMPSLPEPPSLSDAGPADGAAIDQPEVELDADGRQALRVKAAERAPTQTKLADLLEAVWTAAPVVPVAVVVSAWDVVAEMALTPEQWLELNVPLLWQLLVSNSDTHAWRTFGVSAQGGDLRDQGVRRALASITPANDRIVVQDGELTSDITLPLRWLLNL